MTFCFRAGDLPRMCSNSPVVCSSKAGFVGGSSAAGMNGMSPIDCPLGSCRHGIPVGVPVATVASAAAAGGRAGGGDGRASGGGGEGGGAGSFGSAALAGGAAILSTLSGSASAAVGSGAGAGPDARPIVPEADGWDDLDLDQTNARGNVCPEDS
mmetsp:Transcript_46661/g.148885  ORF Transcript_46661/g.148885 Transcript_46661/m.148885 type:complete len:155 (-) Transcript_46661:354-818(-)